MQGGASFRHVDRYWLQPAGAYDLPAVGAAVVAFDRAEPAIGTRALAADHATRSFGIVARGPTERGVPVALAGATPVGVSNSVPQDPAPDVPLSAEHLAVLQHVEPVSEPADLAVDLWADDDEVDESIAEVNRARRANVA